MAKVEIKFDNYKQYSDCLEFLRNQVALRKKRSCYDRAINANCHELINNINEHLNWLMCCNSRDLVISETILLNGARDWNQFVNGATSLFMDSAIAARYCTPSVYKKYLKRDFNGVDWLSHHATGMAKAAKIILILVNRYDHEKI